MTVETRVRVRNHRAAKCSGAAFPRRREADVIDVLEPGAQLDSPERHLVRITLLDNVAQIDDAVLDEEECRDSTSFEPAA